MKGSPDRRVHFPGGAESVLLVLLANLNAHHSSPKAKADLEAIRNCNPAAYMAT